MRKHPETKICFKCQVEKNTEESFYYKPKIDKYSSQCKDCLNEYQNNYNHNSMDPDRWSTTTLPNTYFNEQQRAFVAEFMTKVLGWTFNEKNGIWWKKGLKDKNGVWNKRKVS